MDGLEDKLNAILSDPDAMGRIADMAKSISARSRTARQSGTMQTKSPFSSARRVCCAETPCARTKRP